MPKRSRRSWPKCPAPRGRIAHRRQRLAAFLLLGLGTIVVVAMAIALAAQP